MKTVLLWLVSNLVWTVLLYIIMKIYNKLGTKLIASTLIGSFGVVSGYLLLYPIRTNAIASNEIWLYIWAAMCLFYFVVSLFAYFIPELKTIGWYDKLGAVSLVFVVFSTVKAKGTFLKA